MLLAIDVGNTNIVIGIYNGDELVKFWRLESDQQRTSDEYGIMIQQLFTSAGYKFQDIDDLIISTVVPSLSYTLQHMATKFFGRKGIIVGPGIKTGLIVKYDNPKSLGADRIVDAVAAVSKYPVPLITIDFGTATTFSAISDKNEYLGGVIAPGIKTSSNALFAKAAQLPRIEIEIPDHIICRNTQTCMQAGITYGNIGSTEYIIRKIKEEMKSVVGDKKITVVATGGLAGMIAAEVESIDYVDRELTLRGLQILYEKNKDRFDLNVTEADEEF